MSISEQARATTRWNFDPTHSLAEFSVKHMMITTVKGRFETIEGTLEIDHAEPGNSRVEVSIDAGSVNTSMPQRDAHLRSGDFFDAENHPKITFRSRRVVGGHEEPGDRFRILGDLTIRGETREVELDVTFEGTGTDPWGGERGSFSAQTTIDRREFGLTWNQGLEAGGVLVSNQVRIFLEVQAVRSDD
jgi:polyisoprenoid-binding protein YceI